MKKACNRKVQLRLEYLEDRSVPAQLAALADGNKLLLFEDSSPGNVSTINISGLMNGETLSGLDRWSINGQLYAVGSRSELTNVNPFGDVLQRYTTFYTINPINGVATRVSETNRQSYILSFQQDQGPNTILTTLGGLDSGNPLVARLFNPLGNNNELLSLRNRFYHDYNSFSAAQGAPRNITNGVDLAYQAGDVNFGLPMNLTDAAIDFNPTLPADIYFLDAQQGVLARQTMLPDFISPPTSIVTVGSLGVDFTSKGGFDIVNDTAYAALTNSNHEANLYTIDLSTGAATLLGTLPGVTSVSGLVVLPAGDQNQAPVAAGPRDVDAFEDDAAVFSTALGTAIIVTDPDAAPDEIFTAELHSIVHPENGFPNNSVTFTLGSTAGITFLTGDGVADSHIVFQGTLSAINAALDGLAISTLYANRYSLYDAEWWGHLLVSDPNTVHAGGAAVAMHEFTIDFAPVDDGPPIAKNYHLTLPAGQVFARQGVFEASTFGVDLDELYLYKAKIVSVTPGVNSGAFTTFSNPEESQGQPFWAFVDYYRPDGFTGTDVFTYTITDGSGNMAVGTITVDVQGEEPAADHIIAVGADTGNLPQVLVMDADTLETISNFQAFSSSFKGGVRVAVGHLRDNERADVVVAQARNGDGWVRAFTAEGQPLDGNWGKGVQPFGKTRQSLEIAVGDVNGDGYDDVAVSGIHQGARTVRYFSGINALYLGQKTIRSYLGSWAFTLADLNGDQRADLVTLGSNGRSYLTHAWSAGTGSALAVANPFAGLDSNIARKFLGSRQAGLSIAAGDIDGDGIVDVVGSVTSIKGETLARSRLSLSGTSSLFFQQPSRFRGSLLTNRLALIDVNLDGILDVLMGASGGTGTAENLTGVSAQFTDILFAKAMGNRWQRGFSLAAG
ncbi:MAG: DUF4394 domain-containing protein [Planctomycetia bacterium]|nr:DUF4394 domain-containing protein [Planctomycetia bacterium]